MFFEIMRFWICVVLIIFVICLYKAFFEIRDSLKDIAKELKRMNDLKDGGNKQ